ncbi:hypothetical protein MNBD_DELTA04-231 [hydrothermal vent metagenome]|uniref:ATPase n=1 Tax=hydrothermal vent metagenome TaxID=652676 RepID=A0A3B0V4D6_9ZZZZ
MKRQYTDLLHELLGLFPCVAIVGVRQCGKTTLLKQLPEPWRHFDLEKGSDYEVISRDPDLFLRLNPTHTAIDEAQLLPELFSSLRVAIDADRSRSGRFVITGSSSPELTRSIAESLAGRVAVIELAPLAFSEIFMPSPSPLVRLVVDKARPGDFLQLTTSDDTLAHVHDYWLRGGYPEPWLKNSPRFTKLWAGNYIQTYLERDILQLFPGLNRQKYRLFLQMLGNISGSIVNYSNMARILAISQPTAREYLQIAHGTFIWRHIPAFVRNASKRLVKHPKGYLRDSGLLHFLLHLYTIDDLLAHPVMGSSWEAMVIEELLRGFNILGVPCQYFYYRTGGGAEVDLVLEGEFGLIPVEIKYGQKVPGRELRPIRDFIREFDCPYGLVINNADRTVLYDERLVGVPFGAGAGSERFVPEP